MGRKNKNVEVEVPMPKDDGSTFNKESHLINLEREVKLAQAQLKELIRRKELFEEEKALLVANNDIIMKKFKLLKHTWEFETDAKYIENTKLLNALTFERKLLDFDIQIDRANNVINQVKAQVDSLVNEMKRVKGEKNE